MSSPRKRGNERRSVVIAVFALALSGCGGSGNYVWYTELPKSEVLPTNDEYVIGIGDVISIRVYEQENISNSAKIRRDGRIALPLVGEIQAAGKHPSALAQELEVKLKPFVVSPRVTVNIEQSQPVSISTMGEITNKGSLTLEPPGILIQALAQAGGPSEFADKSRIFILRQFPAFQRIRFTYDAILENEHGAAGFRLRTGDVIFIE